ncbi:MAG: hypothetical protein QXU98_11975 [Candidatus Parvarchaeota archaeon]
MNHQIEKRDIDGAMIKKVEIENKLLIALLQRILKISNRRSIVEMSYALIKSVFHGGHDKI